MAYLSSSASSATKPASKTLNLIQTQSLPLILRNSTSILASSIILHGFSSTSSSDSPPPDSSSADDQSLPPSSAAEDPGQSDQGPEAPRKPTREQRRKPEKLEETLCYMMARRPWTTRLQNSIRWLVPNFNQPLVLAVLRGAGDPERALRFFRWVEKTGFRHDRETYSEIISILTRAKMLNHARCILIDDMPKRSVDREEQMFASLIEGYGRAGIPQEAVKIFRQMPEFGVDRTIRSYDAFFKAILRSGRVMMAKRVFNSMIRDGFRPSLSTYNTLIWGFSLSIKMETATRFFSDMKERGVSPDIITYNSLLNGWVRGKKIEEAEKVFEEMGKVGLAPNSVSYNLMIKGYMSTGKLDDGLRLFSEMQSKELRPGERTYAALMPWLCDDPGRTLDAYKVFNEMAERRMTPKNKDKTVFVRLIASMCESGDLDGAVEVHRKMDRFHVPVGSLHYDVLIEGLCKGGKFDVAVEILDELLEKRVLLGLQSPPLGASAYNPVIEFLCGSGSTAKAETFFRQLMKRGVDDKIAFNHLIRGHAKEGKPELAFEILSIMTRRGVESDADAYVLLIESFLKKGEPADARTVLDSMMEQGHLPSPALFRSVMVGLFNDERVQTASRVMKSMIEKGVMENRDMVHKILEALLMRGHVQEALGRIDLMLMNDCAPDLDSLVVALCDSEKVIPALKLVDFGLERDCEISFSSYDRLLEALSLAGKTLPAYSILCKIKAKGGVVDKNGCDAVIKSLIDQGNTKQADILSRMLAGKAPIAVKKGKKFTMDAY